MPKEIIYVGIDPGGEKGALAIMFPDGSMTAEKLDCESTFSLYDQLKDLKEVADIQNYEIRCMVEDAVVNVSSRIPMGMAPDKARMIMSSIFKSSTKLAYHCGVLDACLDLLKIPFTKVRPNIWMKEVAKDRPKGYTKNSKEDRKKYIHNVMHRKYPKLENFFIYQGDAVGVLDYLLQSERSAA